MVKTKINELKMPAFRHGLNILMQPDQFDLSKVDAPFLTNEIADNNKDFFTGDFIKYRTLIDQFNDEHAQAQYIETTGAKQEIETISIDISGTPIHRLCIRVKSGSDAKLVIQYSGHSLLSQGYSAQDIKVIAERNCKLELVVVSNMDSEVYSFQKRQVLMASKAVVQVTDLCLGSQYTRLESMGYLNGRGATHKATALFLGQAEQKYDIYTAAYHQAKNTTSSLVTRGVLRDRAKAVSRGLIHIDPIASGSNGFEKQDTLLLSSEAEADAIPDLEIQNSDVTCSHGSTIGAIDEEKLFYLMSRGLSRQESKHKITEGYFLPLIDKLDKKLGEKLMSEIKKSLL